MEINKAYCQLAARRLKQHGAYSYRQMERNKGKIRNADTFNSRVETQAAVRFFLKMKRPLAKTSIDVTAIVPEGNSGTGIAGAGPQLLQPCMLHMSLAWT